MKSIRVTCVGAASRAWRVTRWGQRHRCPTSRVTGIASGMQLLPFPLIATSCSLVNYTFYPYTKLLDYQLSLFVYLLSLVSVRHVTYTSNVVIEFGMYKSRSMLPVFGQGCIIKVSHEARSCECVCSCSRATTEWEQWNRNLAHRTEVGYRSSAAGVQWRGRKCVTLMSRSPAPTIAAVDGAGALLVWMDIVINGYYRMQRLFVEFVDLVGRDKLLSLLLYQSVTKKRTLSKNVFSLTIF